MDQDDKGAETRPAMLDATVADLEALRMLPQRIQEAGYSDVYLLYGMMHLRRDVLRRELAATPPALRALIELFALGGVVPADSVAPILPLDVQDSLRRLGVLLQSPHGIHCGELTLMPFWGRAAFVPTPRRNPTAFFGDDITGLLARLTPALSARALNLHAGPGLAALRLADGGTDVIAVEDNALARACAELNAVMNGLQHRISVCDGAALAKQPGSAAYDYVVANLPPLPFPQRLFLAATDPAQKTAAASLSPTEHLLSSLPGLLNPSGHAQLTGAGLGDSSGPSAVEELDRMARQHGMAIVMTVSCQTVLLPDSPLLGNLAWACHSVTGLTFESSRDRLLLHLEQLGHRHLYLFYILARKSPGGAGLSVCRHDRLGRGFWFR